MEPKLDDDRCDSTQIVLIDPHEINLEKNFEENHPVKKKHFGDNCEENGRFLESNNFSFNLNSGGSQSYLSKSNLQFLPKFSSCS